MPAAPQPWSSRMPNFRRAYVPGGTFFFTVVTDQRAPFLCDAPARRLLGKVIRQCQARWPMQIDAVVLLPDHLHTIWTLPPGDKSYSKRWGWVKKEFTRAWLADRHAEQPQTAGRIRDGRRGVFQAKFWEHAIRDEHDLGRHFDYIHYNPVKHGVAACPHRWPWSSSRRWVRAGAYNEDWGCVCSGMQPSAMDFSDVAATAGE